MTQLALIFIGFSLLSALQMALTHFRAARYGGLRGVQFMGIVLVMALGGLQLAHWAWLYLDLPWVTSLPYRMLLFTVAPAFWAFSHPVLGTERATGTWRLYAVHLLPVAIAPWLTAQTALPLAFVAGSGYLLALARDVYRLRAQRAQFGREILMLCAVFVMAWVVAALGLLQAQLPDKLFFAIYAIAIGMAFLLVQVALGLRPHLPEEVTECAKAVYANSTLTRVNRHAAIARLQTVMDNDRIYEDANLSLATLAQRLDLSGHQLSELINSQLGKNFARYLRERRIAAAKALLLSEPSASVLSVGLRVGFNAQSNFYEAFREIEGMTPGQFRKLHRKRADATTPDA